MNKKIVIILAIVILAIVGIAGGSYLVKQRQEIRKKAAPATTIAFQPATAEAKVGETVNFDVLVNTGTNSLAAVRLDIDYDQSVLQATSLTFSSLLPTILRPINISQPGKVTGSAGVATGTLISGTGQKIASLSFKVLSTAPLGTTISFGSNTLASSATTEDPNKNLIVSKNPAKIVIASLPEPTPTPTSAPAPTTIPTATPTETPTTLPTNTPTPTTGASTEGGISPTAILTPVVTTSPQNEGEKIPITGKTVPTFLLFTSGVILILSALLVI